jgi:hypothetical protein
MLILKFVYTEMKKYSQNKIFIFHQNFFNRFYRINSC